MKKSASKTESDHLETSHAIVLLCNSSMPSIQMIKFLNLINVNFSHSVKTYSHLNGFKHDGIIECMKLVVRHVNRPPHTSREYGCTKEATGGRGNCYNFQETIASY